MNSPATGAAQPHVTAWPKKRLKYLVREIDERAGASGLPLLAVSMHYGVRRSTDMPRAEELTSYKICRPGDVVLNRMRAFQGALGLAGEAGLVSPDYAVLRPLEGLSARFLSYLLRSHWGIAQMASRLRGIGGTAAGNVRTPRLNVEDLKDIRAAIPSMAEQEAVADFLDRESGRIDVLVEEVKVSGALTATAHTDGLRHLIFGTPSDLVPLKFYAQTGTGHTPSRERPEYWVPSECVIPWFTLADIHQIRDGRRVEVQETSECVSEAGLANSSAVKLPAGTVILSRTASVGFSAIMGVDMAVSQDFMTWTCGLLVEPRYLLLTLRAMQPELRGLMYGSTHKTIYMPDLHALRVPLPDLEVQADIVERARWIGASTWPLADEIAATEKVLAEYRDSLITEAVTGQLDVSRLSDAQMDESLDAVREGNQPEALAS